MAICIVLLTFCRYGTGLVADLGESADQGESSQHHFLGTASHTPERGPLVRSLRPFSSSRLLRTGLGCHRLVEHRVRSASRLKPLLWVVRGSLRARRKVRGGGGRRRHRLGVLSW